MTSAPVPVLVPSGVFQPPHGPRRAVRAWLPEGWSPDRPHATLLLLDGQNVFSDHGSFAGGWHAHEAVGRLGRTMWRPMIVAVPNGGTHRITEMGTHAADFADALAERLVPRLRARWGGGGPLVVAGASLGGLTALLALLRHPDVFDGAVAMSPSLWFAHRRWLHAILEGSLPLPARGRLYLDAGQRERGRMFPDAALLAAHLGAAGWGADRLLWRPDARGTHHERHWRRRLPKALRFVFRKDKL